MHLFGGDPSRVTVFGVSAGGGSIMHHITGRGGAEKAPFDRAIVQSPGWQTVLDVPGIWKRTLATASQIAGRPITNGAELAALDPSNVPGPHAVLAVAGDAQAEATYDVQD